MLSFCKKEDFLNKPFILFGTLDPQNPYTTYSLAGEIHHISASSRLRFHPPSGFSDSREFSEAECDRERALDLEVQSVMANSGGDAKKIDRDELASLLAR